MCSNAPESTPESRGDRVFLNGLDGSDDWAGIASVDSLSIGGRQPGRFTVTFVPVGLCGVAADGRCKTRIELHTRADWTTGDDDDGDSVALDDAELQREMEVGGEEGAVATAPP